MSEGNEKYSFKSLFAAPKGCTSYKSGDAFLLHVFWEAPSLAAAQELLRGLQQCARATHRDTPCVPTYFFRISSINASICSAIPRLVKDHPHILTALKKIQVGAPRNAVLAELARRRLDASLLDLNLDAELPEVLQSQPVAVEFTEVYLDEQSFMLHAASREYLDGYAVVMDPSLHYTVPKTIRFGTPPQTIVEGILEPILHETVHPVPSRCFVWKALTALVEAAVALRPVFFSCHIQREENESTTLDSIGERLSSAFFDSCSTCVVFQHPLLEGIVRLMCVFYSIPPASLLLEVQALAPVAGEAHCASAPDELKAVLADCGLAQVEVNPHEFVGYALHEKVYELSVKSESS
jgi:hypothetical protein